MAKVSFLPVPVAISAKVRRAFNTPPISHRSNEFRQILSEAKALLLGLTGAEHTELLLGSGTLANEVVAAQLSLLDEEGLVLTNGEFGERLVDHANRHRLSFTTFKAPWGDALDYVALKKRLSGGKIRWIWAAHCETFLGTLNSQEKLEEICQEHGIKLCLDCISSVGAVPVRLNKIYLATAVSGKGLASYPGISMVFYNHGIAPDNRLPRYLDLGHYWSKAGVPFTHSSNLMMALREALVVITKKPKFEFIQRESDWLRGNLERLGIPIVSGSAELSPAILTLALPQSVSSVILGEDLEQSGHLLSYGSDYLVKNNLLRICLFGATTHRDHRQMLESLARCYSHQVATGKKAGIVIAGNKAGI